MSKANNLQIIRNRKNSVADFLEYCLSQNRTELIFIATMVISIVSFLTICCIKGEVFYSFYFYKSGEDIFMDFFNSVRDASQGMECYSERGVIYPPLANLFYLFCSRFATDVSNNALSENKLDIYTDVSSMMMFFYSTVALVVILVATLTRYQKNGRSLKFVLIFFSVFNAPFFYLFERGNIVLAAYVFTMIFVFYFDNEDKKIRIIAIIALVLAAGIKLYPAVFGLLLLTNKQYKTAVKAAIGGIMTVIIPSLFFGSDYGALYWIKNIIRFSSDKNASNSFIGVNSVKSIYYIIMTIFHRIGELSPIINLIFVVVPVFICLLAIFVLPKKWQKVFAVVIMMLNIPGCSGHYSLVFLLIPMLMMMFEKQIYLKDYLYFIFSIPIFPFYVFPIYFQNQALSVNRFICGVFATFIFVVITKDTVVELIKIVKRQRPIVIPYSENYETLSSK